MLGLRGLQFFKAAEDDETYWDDNIRHPAMSWLARGGRGVPKSRKQLVAEAALAGVLAALVPEMSAPQGAVNSWGQGITTRAIFRRNKRKRPAAPTADVKRKAGPPPAKKSKARATGGRK